MSDVDLRILPVSSQECQRKLSPVRRSNISM